MNSAERRAEVLPVMIRQVHLKAIPPFDEWVQDHLILSEVRPGLLRFRFQWGNDLLNAIVLKKQGNTHDHFFKFFSQLQEVRCSIVRENAIDGCSQVRANGEEGQFDNMQ